MTKTQSADQPPATQPRHSLRALRISDLSTRTRIVLLVLLASLPTLAVTGYSTRDERARARLQAEDNLKRLATMAAQRQEQIVESARQTLVAITQAPVGDTARCNTFLAQLHAQSNGIYHSMGIYRTDALLICNALPWQGDIYSPDRLYFRIPMATGKLAIGEYQVGRVTRQQGINVGYPIADSAGNVTGVAFVAINLARLNHMAAATPLPDGAILMILDRDGVMLARNPERAGVVGVKLQNLGVLQTVLSGRSGLFARETTDGEQRLWAYAAVTDNPDGVIPLRVLVSIPMNMVFAAANQTYKRDLICIALATVLLLLAAWYGTEILVLRKVRVLLDAASRVHSGDLDVRTGWRRERDELSQIGAAFDEMTHALQDREIEFKQVLGKLNEQAITDPLTGLHNRRYLMEFLQRELARAARGATTVAAIMFDIDHFKRVNDRHGHDAGDLVLTQIAGRIKGYIRASDMVCRYGGEEFMLILPGASLDGARQRAEGIRALVRSIDFRYAGEPLGTITVSLGVALFPDHAGAAESLIRVADEALYAAKSAGRDRVVVADMPGAGVTGVSST